MLLDPAIEKSLRVLQREPVRSRRKLQKKTKKLHLL
eukprot:SAG31_NODE_23176_length_509_cov_1.456098_1_plen_35_part_01